MPYFQPSTLNKLAAEAIPANAKVCGPEATAAAIIHTLDFAQHSGASCAETLSVVKALLYRMEETTRAAALLEASNAVSILR
jgi:hypothetical protein